MGSLGSLLAGFVLCKLFGVADLASLFGGLFTPASYSGPPGGKAPAETPPAALPETTVLTSTQAPWPGSQPAGLPPWPSGWKAASPVTPAMVSRAWALMPTLALGQRKVEQGPGGSWQTYFKTKLGNGKTAVTVHVPRVAPGASVTT